MSASKGSKRSKRSKTSTTKRSTTTTTSKKGTTRPIRKGAPPPRSATSVAREPLLPRLSVRRSGIQGAGVFTRDPIAAGRRVVEYTGERISHVEASTRYDDLSMARHHTFLFTVDDDVVIDAAKGGNAARFVNHSCAPNCVTSVDDGHVWIWALRDVARGEELTYDYWYTTDAEWSLADLRRIYPCHCGARTCRGTLAAPPPRKRRRKRRVQRAAKTRRTGARARRDARP